MSIGTAFSAFFAILFNKQKSTLWQSANSGSLVSTDEIEKFKLEIQDAQKSTKEGESKISALTGTITQLEASIAGLKADLNKPSDGEEATYTLALLQREGRLIDFLQEDISSFDDAQIGMAVRQVHQGCRKVLEKHFSIEAVVTALEGETVTVAKGFDPSSYELSGNVSGEAPYQGELRHKGWMASKVDLPIRQKGRNGSIICPAEVEI